MGKKHKIVTTVLWGTLVLAMLGVVGTGLWARRLPPLPVLYEAPAFSLTDQDGKPFSSGRLKGKPYVAAFVFTNCPGVCPLMTQKMAALQKSVAGRDVHLVSFTVDPERDTPQVLRQYAERFGAEAERWHFLTGEKGALFDAAKGMKLSALPADEKNPIIHSEKFLLVDGVGRVRGAYNSTDDADLKKLARDAAALVDDGLF